MRTYRRINDQLPEEYSSKMIDMVTRRKGDLVSMETQGDRVNIEFDMPSRGYYRSSYQCTDSIGRRSDHGSPF